MFMHIFFAIAVLVAFSSGSSPSSQASGSGWAVKPAKPRPDLRKRDAIVRATYLKHPSWSVGELHKAAQSRIEAAGLTPISLAMMRRQLVDIRKELGVTRSNDNMRPEHVKFLKELVVKDPRLSRAAALAKFRAAWGPNVETDRRVLIWWHNHARSLHYQAPTDTRPRFPSPTKELQALDLSDEDLPSNWWNLGKDFDDLFPTDPEILHGLH